MVRCSFIGNTNIVVITYNITDNLIGRAGEEINDVI